MTIQTMRLGRVCSRWTNAAKNVRALRDWVKVTWIHAQMISAQMIQYFTVRHWAEDGFVRHAVRDELFVVSLEAPVRLPSASMASPLPTVTWFAYVYAGPEPFHLCGAKCHRG